MNVPPASRVSSFGWPESRSLASLRMTLASLRMTCLFSRMALVRIALANLRYADSAELSVTLAERAIADAAREKAAIVCFPEAYVPGYRAETLIRPAPDPAFLDRARARIANAA